MAIGQIVGAAISGGLNYLSNRSANAKNAKLQREFAQHGIRWKVADAKAAGLHPLAALGAQTISASPSYVGTNFSQEGQDIGRAIDATRTHKERATAETQLVAKLAVERAGLQNELLRTQIARLRQAGQPPARPSLVEGQHLPGQGDVGKLSVKAREVESRSTGNPGMTPGQSPEVSYYTTPGGSVVPMPSDRFKQAMEDDIPAEIQYNLRNRLVDVGSTRPQVPENKYMWYDYWLGKWRYPRYRPRIPYYWSHHPARTGAPYR